MASTSNRDNSGGGPPGQALVWRVWLPRRRPLLSVAVAMLVVVLTAGIAVTHEGLFYPLLTFLVLAAAVSGHYAPIWFRLDGEGVHVASIWGHRTKPWCNLKTYWPNDQDGVAVSASVQRGPLTRASDLYLYFAGNREEVLRYLVYHLSPAQSSDHS